MILYELNEELAPLADDLIEQLVDAGILVLAVRCVHGNIDGHHPYYQTEKMDPTYCPGAGIGDTG